MFQFEIKFSIPHLGISHFYNWKDLDKDAFVTGFFLLFFRGNFLLLGIILNWELSSFIRHLNVGYVNFNKKHWHTFLKENVPEWDSVLNPIKQITFVNYDSRAKLM